MMGPTWSFLVFVFAVGIARGSEGPDQDRVIQVTVRTVALGADQPDAETIQAPESEACSLALTFRNVSKEPVIFKGYKIKGDGIVSPLETGLPPHILERYHREPMLSHGIEYSGSDTFVSTYVWVRQRGPDRDAPASPPTLRDLSWGLGKEKLLWVSPRAILFPDQILHVTHSWIPMDRTGKRDLDVRVDYHHLTAGPTVRAGVFFRGEIPEPPSEITEEDNSFGITDIQFQVAFQARPRAWDENTSFVDAVIQEEILDLAKEVTHQQKVRIESNRPALTEMIPQVKDTISGGLRSSFLKTWFLFGAKGTHVLREERRTLLGFDAQDFLASRLLAGEDAASWKVGIRKDTFVDFLPVVQSYPQQTEFITTVYEIPPQDLIERMHDADRLGYWINGSGNLENKKKHTDRPEEEIQAEQ